MVKQTDFEVMVDDRLKAEAEKFQKAFGQFESAVGEYNTAEEAATKEAKKHLEELDKLIERAEQKKESATKEIANLYTAHASDSKKNAARQNAVKARMELEELKDEREFWLDYSPCANIQPLFDAVMKAATKTRDAETEADTSIGILCEERTVYINRLKERDYFGAVKTGFGSWSFEHRLKDIQDKDAQKKTMRDILGIAHEDQAKQLY